MAYSHIGSKVRIKVIEGDEFSGFVHSIDANTGKLTLDKVTLCGRAGVNRRIQGLQHFYGKEIQTIIKCEEVCSKLRKNASTGSLNTHKDLGPCLKTSKEKPHHLKRLRKLTTEGLLLGARQASSDDESNVKSKISSGGKSSDCDSEVSDTNSYDPDSRYHLIKKLDDKFFNAIATKDDLILLDYLSIGEKCLSEGLKEILESKKILKVLHDCRLVSDLLHHQFLIELVNIFDTQVADVIIYHIRNKDWPRYVSGLSSCLFSHLELSSEQVHIMRVRESAKKEDQEIWCKRPAPQFVMEAAVKHVEHLLDLRLVLMEKMMTEFTVGVDIFLAQVKNVSDVEATRALTSSHLLPFAFQHLNQFLHASHFNYTMPLRMRSPSSTETDKHGFQENCSGIMDPEVIASVDSIWHRGINHKCPGVRKRSKSLDRRISERQEQRSNMAMSDCESELKPSRHSQTPAVDESQTASDSHNYSETFNPSPAVNSSQKLPQFIVPKVGTSVECRPMKSMLKESKSLSSLKLEDHQEQQWSGSELLKAMMSSAANTSNTNKESFAVRPAGALPWVVPKKRRSHGAESSGKKCELFSSDNENSYRAVDDYFGDIPSREVLNRSETLVGERLCESVPVWPRAIINGGSGKMIISLSSSDSDSSDGIRSRKFECLEKRAQALEPILSKTFLPTPCNGVSDSCRTKRIGSPPQFSGSTVAAHVSHPTSHSVLHSEPSVHSDLPASNTQSTGKPYTSPNCSSYDRTSSTGKPYTSPNCSSYDKTSSTRKPYTSPNCSSYDKTSSTEKPYTSPNCSSYDKTSSTGKPYTSPNCSSYDKTSSTGKPYTSPNCSSYDKTSSTGKPYTSPNCSSYDKTSSTGKPYTSPNCSSYDRTSSTSPHHTTPSRVGRGRSPTIYSHNSSGVSVCPTIGRGGSPMLYPSNMLRVSPGTRQAESPSVYSHNASVNISPHGRGTTTGTDNGTSYTTDVNDTISPRGRGTTVSDVEDGPGYGRSTSSDSVLISRSIGRGISL